MRFKPTGFYVLDLVWAKAACWPGGALAPVKHVYLKSSVVFCSHASGFAPPSWAAAWPSSASTPEPFTFPMGLEGHLASAEGKMKAHPSDLPRAPAPFQCRTVTRPLWWREEPSRLSPGRTALGQLSQLGRAGTECILSLLTPLSLSAQAAPTSHHDGFSTAPFTNCFIRHAWLPSPKKPQTLESNCRGWGHGVWLMQSWETLAGCDSTAVK